MRSREQNGKGEKQKGNRVKGKKVLEKEYKGRKVRGTVAKEKEMYREGHCMKEEKALREVGGKEGEKELEKGRRS